MARTRLDGYKCEHCQHEWVPRNTRPPRTCPSCRSAYNNQPPPKLQLDGYRCERCSHKWVPRATSTPRICPSCKSAYYDRPSRTPKADSAD